MSTQSYEKKIRVGLLGFGFSGKIIHGPLLKAHGGFEVVGVLSSKTSLVAETFPQVTPTVHLEALLDNPQIDLIVNTLPNEFHFSYSKKALEAGKNVVIEKPFVNTVAEGQELIAIASRYKTTLTVFQNRRWDGDFLTVKKILDSQALGEVVLFESFFDRLRPTPRLERWREMPQRGSGILFDLGAHLIDQALTLFGSPERVFSDVEIQRKGGLTDDYFQLILKYNKMRVVLRSSSFTNLTPRFFIQGTKGYFIKYGLDPQEQSLKEGAHPCAADFGVESKNFYGSLNGHKIASEKGNYLRFYEGLYDYLEKKGEALPVEPLQSLEVIKMIEKCLQKTFR